MKYVLPTLMGFATVAAIAGGVVLLFHDSSAGSSIQVVLPTATPVRLADIKVYISGAVLSPGVYQVEPGTRVIDLLQVAGGAIGDADLDAVNLAMRVADEDHLYIPRVGEDPPVQTTRAADGGKLDLNSATVEELMGLPGIGEVRAAAIVAYRETVGRFSSVNDLTAVSGLGAATVESIRALVEVQ